MRQAAGLAQPVVTISVDCDEESEEDFAFLDNELKDKKELDEISQRLLQGIIQAPPMRKKRFDKMTREEIWERRRQKALDRGEVYSGEYDDEVDDEEYQTIGIGDSLEHGVSGAKMRNKVKMSRRNKIDPTNDSHPDCPEGFDPDKWAKMSLEEKCKHLGIDVKEWLKMNREQQMQRMHNLANNFKFYSMDKVAQDNVTSGRKKWHL